MSPNHHVGKWLVELRHSLLRLFLLLCYAEQKSTNNKLVKIASRRSTFNPGTAKFCESIYRLSVSRADLNKYCCQPACSDQIIVAGVIRGRIV
jgi:hypothetical protein